MITSMFDGGQTVGNGKHSASPHNPLQRLLHKVLTLSVQRTVGISLLSPTKEMGENIYHNCLWKIYTQRLSRSKLCFRL